MQGVQRVMRAAARPKAVAEAQEVGLIDDAQHLGDRTLDNLVLKRRDTKLPSPSVGLRDVGSTHRMWPVSPGMHTVAQRPEIALQLLFVCLTVTPSTPALAARRCR